MDLLCGAARAAINPPAGTLLAGYIKERPSKGVRAPIFAKVLYMKNKDQNLLLISLDLIAIDLKYTKNLRRKLNQKFSIPYNNIIVHATHTHSGPGGSIHENSVIWKAFSNIWMPYNMELVEEQYEQIIQAVEEAIANAEKSKVGFSTGEAAGIAANRISPERDYQPNLNVVKIQKASGKKIILYHFSAHPTILHDDNCYVSADYPGVSSIEIEKQEDIEIAIFLNGPSGDISTRFTRKSSTFEEVNRLGELLANQVKAVFNQTKVVNVTDIVTRVIPLELPIRKMKTVEVLEKEYETLQNLYQDVKKSEISVGERRTIESELEGMAASLKLTQKMEGITTIQSEIQILMVGTICFASIPGEAFHETGKEIVERLNNKDSAVLLLGNTNDYIGYIVPEYYYEEGNYESSMTILEKGSSEKIRDLLINNIGGILNVSI